jgi:hypothetical protein
MNVILECCLSGLLVVLLSLVESPALAAGTGQVQQMSGTLSAQRADGSVRILSQKSDVLPGDVLTTQKDSYVQINFTDGSSMTMRPNTQLKIEAYQFEESKPQEDNALFRLIRGGLRTVTGLVGKRGNQDAYRIGTVTATIGVRGSSGETLDCTQSCEGVVAGGEKIQKGVYHTTYTGSYILQNEGGFEIIGEGQFGFVRDSTSKPEILQSDPGFNLKDLLVVGGSFMVGEGCIVR